MSEATPKGHLNDVLSHDWGDEWDKLPPAPPLVFAEPKTSQITLRLPSEMVAVLKEVARRRALPYHSLARSWIVDALRSRFVPSASAEVVDLAKPGNAQLNLKLPPELIDELKRFSNETRTPYHRLARLWIDAALRTELAESAYAAPQPSLNEVMLLLLDTPKSRGRDAAVRGATRLQKLMFVIEKSIAPNSDRFYAYNFGPFDEEVFDAAEALRERGMIAGAERRSDSAPTADEMIASVMRHKGQPAVAEKFQLTREGHEAAKRLRRSRAAYSQLADRIREIRDEWDKSDLVDRVYEAYPEYAERSLIKDEVAGRKRSRRAKSS